MPTHGALSKAGKVRSQTPKLDAKERVSPSPKVKNRSLYRKRITLERRIGQYRPRRRFRR